MARRELHEWTTATTLAEFLRTTSWDVENSCSAGRGTPFPSPLPIQEQQLEVAPSRQNDFGRSVARKRCDVSPAAASSAARNWSRPLPGSSPLRNVNRRFIGTSNLSLDAKAVTILNGSLSNYPFDVIAEAVGSDRSSPRPGERTRT